MEIQQGIRPAEGGVIPLQMFYSPIMRPNQLHGGANGASGNLEAQTVPEMGRVWQKDGLPEGWQRQLNITGGDVVDGAVGSKQMGALPVEQTVPQTPEAHPTDRIPQPVPVCLIKVDSGTDSDCNTESSTSALSNGMPENPRDPHMDKEDSQRRHVPHISPSPPSNAVFIDFKPYTLTRKPNLTSPQPLELAAGIVQAQEPTKDTAFQDSPSDTLTLVLQHPCYSSLQQPLPMSAQDSPSKSFSDMESQNQAANQMSSDTPSVQHLTPLHLTACRDLETAPPTLQTQGNVITNVQDVSASGDSAEVVIEIKSFQDGTSEEGTLLQSSASLPNETCSSGQEQNASGEDFVSNQTTVESNSPDCVTTLYVNEEVTMLIQGRTSNLAKLSSKDPGAASLQTETLKQTGCQSNSALEFVTPVPVSVAKAASPSWQTLEVVTMSVEDKTPLDSPEAKTVDQEAASSNKGISESAVTSPVESASLSWQNYADNTTTDSLVSFPGKETSSTSQRIISTEGAPCMSSPSFTAGYASPATSKSASAEACHLPKRAQKSTMISESDSSEHSRKSFQNTEGHSLLQDCISTQTSSNPPLAWQTGGAMDTSKSPQEMMTSIPSETTPKASTEVSVQPTFPSKQTIHSTTSNSVPLGESLSEKQFCSRPKEAVSEHHPRLPKLWPTPTHPSQLQCFSASDQESSMQVLGSLLKSLNDVPHSSFILPPHATDPGAAPLQVETIKQIGCQSNSVLEFVTPVPVSIAKATSPSGQTLEVVTMSVEDKTQLDSREAKTVDQEAASSNEGMSESAVTSPVESTSLSWQDYADNTTTDSLVSFPGTETSSTSQRIISTEAPCMSSPSFTALYASPTTSESASAVAYLSKLAQKSTMISERDLSEHSRKSFQNTEGHSLLQDCISTQTSSNPALAWQTQGATGTFKSPQEMTSVPSETSFKAFSEISVQPTFLSRYSIHSATSNSVSFGESQSAKQFCSNPKEAVNEHHPRLPKLRPTPRHPSQLQCYSGSDKESSMQVPGSLIKSLNDVPHSSLIVPPHATDPGAASLQAETLKQTGCQSNSALEFVTPVPISIARAASPSWQTLEDVVMSVKDKTPLDSGEAKNVNQEDASSNEGMSESAVTSPVESTSLSWQGYAGNTTTDSLLSFPGKETSSTSQQIISTKGAPCISSPSFTAVYDSPATSESASAEAYHPPKLAQKSRMMSERDVSEHSRKSFQNTEGHSLLQDCLSTQTSSNPALAWQTGGATGTSKSPQEITSIPTPKASAEISLQLTFPSKRTIHSATNNSVLIDESPSAKQFCIRPKETVNRRQPRLPKQWPTPTYPSQPHCYSSIDKEGSMQVHDNLFKSPSDVPQSSFIVPPRATDPLLTQANPQGMMQSPSSQLPEVSLHHQRLYIRPEDAVNRCQPRLPKQWPTPTYPPQPHCYSHIDKESNMQVPDNLLKSPSDVPQSSFMVPPQATDPLLTQTNPQAMMQSPSSQLPEVSLHHPGLPGLDSTSLPSCLSGPFKIPVVSPPAVPARQPQTPVSSATCYIPSPQCIPLPADMSPVSPANLSPTRINHLAGIPSLADISKDMPFHSSPPVSLPAFSSLVASASAPHMKWPPTFFCPSSVPKDTPHHPSTTGHLHVPAVRLPTIPANSPNLGIPKGAPFYPSPAAHRPPIMSSKVHVPANLPPMPLPPLFAPGCVPRGTSSEMMPPPHPIRPPSAFRRPDYLEASSGVNHTGAAFYKNPPMCEEVCPPPPPYPQRPVLPYPDSYLLPVPSHNRPQVSCPSSRTSAYPSNLQLLQHLLTRIQTQCSVHTSKVAGCCCSKCSSRSAPAVVQGNIPPAQTVKHSRRRASRKRTNSSKSPNSQPSVCSSTGPALSVSSTVNQTTGLLATQTSFSSAVSSDPERHLKAHQNVDAASSHVGTSYKQGPNPGCQVAPTADNPVVQESVPVRTTASSNSLSSLQKSQQNLILCGCFKISGIHHPGTSCPKDPSLAGKVVHTSGTFISLPEASCISQPTRRTSPDFAKCLSETRPREEMKSSQIIASKVGFNRVPTGDIPLVHGSSPDSVNCFPKSDQTTTRLTQDVVPTLCQPTTASQQSPGLATKVIQALLTDLLKDVSPLLSKVITDSIQPSPKFNQTEEVPSSQLSTSSKSVATVDGKEAQNTDISSARASLKDSAFLKPIQRLQKPQQKELPSCLPITSFQQGSSSHAVQATLVPSEEETAPLRHIPKFPKNDTFPGPLQTTLSHRQGPSLGSEVIQTAEVPPAQLPRHEASDFLKRLPSSHQIGDSPRSQPSIDPTQTQGEANSVEVSDSPMQSESPGQVSSQDKETEDQTSSIIDTRDALSTCLNCTLLVAKVPSSRLGTKDASILRAELNLPATDEPENQARFLCQYCKHAVFRICTGREILDNAKLRFSKKTDADGYLSKSFLQSEERKTFCVNCNRMFLSKDDRVKLFKKSKDGWVPALLITSELNIRLGLEQNTHGLYLCGMCYKILRHMQEAAAIMSSGVADINKRMAAGSYLHSQQSRKR